MPKSKKVKFFSKKEKKGRTIRANFLFEVWFLSQIEDLPDRSFYNEIGISAATNAINENKSMNLPVTFMEDGWVVQRMPQGNIERISKIEVDPFFIQGRKLTKGTVLHVKKSN